MAEYVTDPEILKQLEGDEYVTDPTILEQLEGPRSATAIMQEPKSFWENITAPNVPEDFDLATSAKRVGTAMAIGGGVGSILPGVGTALGTASGLASGVGGEIARNIGASDLTRTGVELVAGEIPAALPVAANMASKVISPANYRAGRAVSIFASDKNKEDALRQTQIKLFGKPRIDLQAEPVNAFETQLSLRQSLYGDEASKIPLDKKVSSVVRQDLYDTIKKTNLTTSTETSLNPNKLIPVTKTEVPNVFIKSPEYKKLMDDIAVLKERTKIEDSEVASLNKILAEDLSKNPAVRESATEDIINLIQNGGVYTVSKKGDQAETKTKIPEEARKQLRLRFNEYLERVTGNKGYDKLKAVEREEFLAEAKDFIPQMVDLGFKVKREELDFVVDSVRNSPEAKKLLIDGVMQHLAGQTSTKALKAEFNRVRYPLKEAGILSDKQIREVLGKINSFDTKSANRETLNNALTLVLTPLLGASSAEASGNVVKPIPKVPISTL